MAKSFRCTRSWWPAQQHCYHTTPDSSNNIWMAHPRHHKIWWTIVQKIFSTTGETGARRIRRIYQLGDSIFLWHTPGDRENFPRLRCLLEQTHFWQKYFPTLREAGQSHYPLFERQQFSVKILQSTSKNLIAQKLLIKLKHLFIRWWDCR